MLKGWAWQAIGLTLTLLGISLGGEAQAVPDSQNKLATSGRQAPELITDRPDKTESAVTVPPGYVQLETDWTFTREDEGGVRLGTHDVPGTLVRIGLVRWMELRIGWNGYTSEKVRVGSFQARERGIGDTELGRQDSPPVGIGRRPTAGDRVSDGYIAPLRQRKFFHPAGGSLVSVQFVALN